MHGPLYAAPFRTCGALKRPLGERFGALGERPALEARPPIAIDRLRKVSPRSTKGLTVQSVEQDTSLQQLRRYHELLRLTSPGDRLRKAGSLSAAVRSLAEAGIRQRHPEASPQEVRVRLAVRLYGRGLARRLFEAIPEDAI